MSRVLERLDDYRPLLGAVLADPPEEDLRTRYVGTELVLCGGEGSGCTRAIVARGSLDIELTLELVDDEGWSYLQPWHYCPEHRP